MRAVIRRHLPLQLLIPRLRTYISAVPEDDGRQTIDDILTLIPLSIVHRLSSQRTQGISTFNLAVSKIERTQILIRPHNK